VRGAKSEDARLLVFRDLGGFGLLPANHWRKNDDTVLTLTNVALESQPRVEPRDVGSIRLLRSIIRQFPKE
jgi:hypothetical protein